MRGDYSERRRRKQWGIADCHVTSLGTVPDGGYFPAMPLLQRLRVREYDPVMLFSQLSTMERLAMRLWRTLIAVMFIATTPLWMGCGEAGVGEAEVTVQPADPSGMPRNRRQRELMEEQIQEQGAAGQTTDAAQ